MLFESTKQRFRTGKLPFEAPYELNGRKQGANALELQIQATNTILKLQTQIRNFKGDKRKQVYVSMKKEQDAAIAYYFTASNVFNRNKPLTDLEKKNNFIRSFLDFEDFKYSWRNECQTNMENAYERDNKVNLLIRPYADSSRLLSIAEALDTTDIQLNMFWQAKDNYIAFYYSPEYLSKNKAPTMVFEIYNGIERTTNIFHINFNRWNISNADKNDFEMHFLKDAYYNIIGYEYGGEIDE
jgi:hypothetical protein